MPTETARGVTARVFSRRHATRHMRGIHVRALPRQQRRSGSRPSRSPGNVPFPSKAASTVTKAPAKADGGATVVMRGAAVALTLTLGGGDVGRAVHTDRQLDTQPGP